MDGDIESWCCVARCTASWERGVSIVLMGCLHSGEIRE